MSAPPDPANDGARPETAVVTGAGGWLGQNLVRELARSRTRVRCLEQDPDAAALLGVLSPAVEVVAGDVRDPAALDRVFDDVPGATVFHAAAVIHPRRSTRELFDVNVGGTELVLDRARRAAASRFVHVSSNSPFGANPSADHLFTEESPYHPYMGYGQSKREAEQLVQRSNDRGDVPAVIVRAPWFYGPCQPERQTRWLRAVRRGRFPLVGSGENRRSMVFTGNLVQGLLCAEASSQAAGRAYWIADAEPYAMRDVLQTVRAAFLAEGLPVQERQPRVPALVGHAAELVDGALQARGRYVQAVHVLGELKDTIACDITRARSEIGYQPEVGLLEGMRISIRWCLAHGQEL